ncbi:Iron (Metal) dependent repressor, DtxR family [uncultured Desulfobacterium sp.]|uniref:Transcriptional regulator MntR n=1 Tax=uncultured Desulfobacterium sp. TaxID=201089 RepID=A0A445MT91_9BACT|nr:Iron (Metal) dependent repressor, DtxR family [uncultured Desulfobacterium sp.]
MDEEIVLSESLEDYLEVILDLEQAQKVARAKDIAIKMGVQRGSVTSALKSLEEKGMINYAPYSLTTLTHKGRQVAEDIARRHGILKNILLKVLNIDETTAESTACRMEHAIDNKSLEKLLLFFDFIYNCPRAGEDWIRSFSKFCSSGRPDKKTCDQCIRGCKVHDDQKNGMNG